MRALAGSPRTRLLFAAAGVSALLLAGCDRGLQQSAMAQIPAPQAALPLTMAAPPPAVPAPPPEALPFAPPAPVVQLVDPGDDYAYMDLAYDMSDAFDDAPPDWTFDDDGVWPWVWETEYGGYRLAEPAPDGWRYYYYEPGEDEPFLIEDPEFAYGFDRGQLAMVYDHDGRALPPGGVYARAPLAGRYVAHAAGLYQAAAGAPRQPVSQSAWLARRQDIQSDRRALADEQTRFPDWRRYHDQHAPAMQARFADERMRREAETARVALAANDRTGAEQAWRQAQAQRTLVSTLRRQGQLAPPPIAPPRGPEPAGRAFEAGGAATAAEVRRFAGAEPRSGRAPVLPEGAGPAERRFEPGREPYRTRGREAFGHAAGPPGEGRALARTRNAPEQRFNGERAARPESGRFTDRARPRFEAPHAQLRSEPSRSERPRAEGPRSQARFEPPRPQARFEAPRPQVRSEGPRPQPRFAAPRPPPRAEAPRPQPHFEAPRPQPHVDAPRPQPQARPAAPAQQAQQPHGGGREHR